MRVYNNIIHVETIIFHMIYLPVSGCKIKDPVTFCGIYITDLLDCMLTYYYTLIRITKSKFIAKMYVIEK